MFYKKQQMYHNNIINPTLYFTSTLKKDALILDLSKTVNSQAAVTTAKPFNKFSDGIIKAFVCYFLSDFYFSPNDSPLKTMKNAFYFI